MEEGRGWLDGPFASLPLQPALFHLCICVIISKPLLYVSVPSSVLSPSHPSFPLLRPSPSSKHERGAISPFQRKPRFWEGSGVLCRSSRSWWVAALAFLPTHQGRTLCPAICHQSRFRDSAVPPLDLWLTGQDHSCPVGTGSRLKCGPYPRPLP